jgi:hypothetical protein
MTVQLKNFDYVRYIASGKPCFVPNDKCRIIGNELNNYISEHMLFPHYYFNFRSGGHVSALHHHRENLFFARLDIENFFYSIGRNRIIRALKDLKLKHPEYHARWSTVKNPYKKPSYALPYGFVQSTSLAMLVLCKSPLGETLRDLSKELSVSVYVDDIILSSNEKSTVISAFHRVLRAAEESNFNINPHKLVSISNEIVAFNCELKKGNSKVTDGRIQKFYAENVSEYSALGFENYCERVKS